MMNRNKHELIKSDFSCSFDGIINDNIFEAALIKILWILKEAYGDSDLGHATYCEYINSFEFGKNFPTSSRMWSAITYTNHGILNNFIRWKQMDWLYNDKDVFDSLKAGAIINLKKHPGESKSNDWEIKNYYNNNKNIILSQIESINPQIIICGNTFQFIRHDFEVKMLETSLDNRAISYTDGRRLFIDADHPSYPSKNDEQYCNQIIDLAKQIKNHHLFI